MATPLSPKPMHLQGNTVITLTLAWATRRSNSSSHPIFVLIWCCCCYSTNGNTAITLTHASIYCYHHHPCVSLRSTILTHSLPSPFPGKTFITLTLPRARHSSSRRPPLLKMVVWLLALRTAIYTRLAKLAVFVRSSRGSNECCYSGLFNVCAEMTVPRIS